MYVVFPLLMPSHLLAQTVFGGVGTQKDSTVNEITNQHYVLIQLKAHKIEKSAAIFKFQS